MKQSNEEFKQALSGSVHVSVKSVFERANNLSKKSFLGMFQAMIALFIVLLIISFVFVNWFDITSVEEFGKLDPSKQSIFNLALTLALAPFIAGVVMMGIHNARGKTTKASHVFNYLNLSLLLGLGSLITSILITLGFALFIFPGIYLYLTTKFTLPLIADRGLSPLRAIIMSIKILHKYTLHIMLVMLVFLLLMLLVFMTLGLAIIWVGPLYFNVFGILYQDIVGDKEGRQQSENESDATILRSNGSDSHFDA